MAKRRRKLTPAQKQARRERHKKWAMIFINGRRKRIRLPPLIDGIPVEEFIARNADPVWLHQNEMWECIPGAGSPDSKPWDSADPF